MPEIKGLHPKKIPIGDKGRYIMRFADDPRVGVILNGDCLIGIFTDLTAGKRGKTRCL